MTVRQSSRPIERVDSPHSRGAEQFYRETDLAVKSAANSSKVVSEKSNLELPSSTGNNEDRPRTTGSSSKVTGRSPELFDSRIRSNPVRHPSFSRSSNSAQFQFDVRCNPWLNRTYDPLWEIRPPSAWEFAIPIVQEM